MAKDTTRTDDRTGIERELKRGSLELICLHLLDPGEAYGYEIATKLTTQTDGALSVTDGTLYPFSTAWSAPDTSPCAGKHPSEECRGSTTA